MITSCLLRPPKWFPSFWSPVVSPQVKVSAFAGFLLLYWKSLKELSITCAGTTIVSLLSIESEILDNRSSYFSVGHVCVVLHINSCICCIRYISIYRHINRYIYMYIYRYACVLIWPYTCVSFANNKTQELWLRVKTSSPLVICIS